MNDTIYRVCYEISDPLTGAKADTCQDITVESTDISKVGPNLDISLNVFPNPFGDYINLEYTLTKVNNIELALYDLNGRKLSSMNNTRKPAGTYAFTFDAAKFANGIYYLQLRTSDGNVTTKMIVKR
jgi:hypothetical protein